ncbi:hypothetical protein OVA11_00975 [Caulobacter sp. SL161]|uniref:hypothetical protein n=1 Tax=Caulobacter sp. SL161 TaxID=2995156 RepID=UPI0022767657|nr:hypothetical protein [Caulobacter sp. SL161]MCY1645686.1 hypothetical protein [Caulobacter sp. SL161]
MTRDEDALRMLAEVQAAGEDLARRARAPVWYHPALGLLMGGLIAVQTQPLLLVFGYYALFVLGLLLLVRAYKRHTGLWINGYRAGRTRWVALIMVALVALAMLLAVWLVRERGLTLAPLVFGALVAVLVAMGGQIWQAAFRADLRDGRPL